MLGSLPGQQTQGGQDDIIWHNGTVSNGQATCNIKISDHQKQAGCTYITHIYARDKSNNEVNVNQIDYKALSVSVPSPISNVVISDISENGYTVTCDVDSAWCAERIQFPTWTLLNGQDDIASDWGNNTIVRGTYSGGKAFFRVKISDHNNEMGDYVTHIYAFDSSGYHTGYAAPVVNVHKHSLVKTSAKAATTTSEGNIEYWTCSSCGKIFKDSAGTTEISKADTVIPKLSSSSESSSDSSSVKTDLPAVKIAKPKAAKKEATVKWKKVSKANQKKITKIQIQYSTDKTFKTGVKTAYAKKSATSKKIKKLTSKKKYYVRIRAYKKSGGVTHISKWSAVKAVKVK